MADDTYYKHEVFKCDKASCSFICYTLNQLHEHSLDKHSTVYIPKYTVNGFSSLQKCVEDVGKENRNDSTWDM